MTDKREEKRIDTEIHRVSGGSDPFAAAVRATRMPMLITDPRQDDNPIVFVNDAFARLTGYDRDETLGRNCRFLQGPDTDRAAIASVREAIEQRVPIEIDLLNYRKDGKTFWNRLLLSPVFDSGELTFFFASQFDVTVDRVRIESLTKDRRALEAEIDGRRRELHAAEDKLKFILAAAKLGTWTLELASGSFTASDQCKAIFGRKPEAPFTLEDIERSLMPDDRERWKVAVEAALSNDGYLEENLRLASEDDTHRWVELRSTTRFDENDAPVAMMGVVIDITERRAAERHRDLLARELSHRVKNTLSTVQAIVGRSLREHGVDEEVVSKIADRLQAIASAHDVLTSHGWSEADLGQIIRSVTDLFKFRKDAIRSTGPKVVLSARAATAIALAMHELASNAVKYGSLSSEEGTVLVSWEIHDGELSLSWTETGGPSASNPKNKGFGSLLIETVLASSTYGTTELDYRDAGLTFTYRAPVNALVEADSTRAY